MLNLDQIEKDTGYLGEREWIDPASASTSTHHFTTDHVLYSKLRPNLNKVVCPEDSGICTTELIRLKPDPKRLNRRFLTYFLRSEYFMGFARQVVAGAKMPRMVMDRFWEFEIPLPPHPEQYRIVEILDQADTLRRQRREVDEVSERILPALFQEMFGDAQTETIKAAKCLGDYITESNYGLSAKADEDASGIPILRMNNVTYEGHLDLKSLKYLPPQTPNLKKSMLQKGDLLFNRTNSRELVGKTALWGPDISAVAASYLIVFRVNETKLLPEFVWAYMNSLFFKDLLLNTARKAIGMANINSREIAAFPIWTPPLERQMKFREALQGIEKSRQNQSASAAALETLFQTLLHRAFDGSLTVKWREGQGKELLQEMEHHSKR